MVWILAATGQEEDWPSYVRVGIRGKMVYKVGFGVGTKNELLTLNLSRHVNRSVSAQSVTDPLRADPHSLDDKSNS
jgi:hypothetical protein